MSRRSGGNPPGDRLILDQNIRAHLEALNPVDSGQRDRRVGDRIKRLHAQFVDRLVRRAR